MHYFFFILVLLVVGCEKSEPSNEGQDPALFISQGEILVFSEITAAPGDTVAIINHDRTPHSVTSESALGAFDDSGLFDVVIPAESSNLLVIPEDTPAGTDLYFYCRFHEGVMQDGIIHVE